jgi:hypothetical protein
MFWRIGLMMAVNPAAAIKKMSKPRNIQVIPLMRLQRFRFLIRRPAAAAIGPPGAV